MDDKQYTQQLFEITKYTQMKLADLQNSLTHEQVLEFSPTMAFFFVNLIESAVGKEDLVKYMIQLLQMADKMATDEDEVKKRQIERYNKLKTSENKEE